MNHEHLPALTRYTSPAQFYALEEIRKTKSMTNLIMQGRLSKTIGSLIRSAWVKSYTYSGEDGVMREGWCVTEAGEHAMNMYVKREEERERERQRVAEAKRQMEEARQKIEAAKQFQREELYEAALGFYRAAKVKDMYMNKCRSIAGSNFFHRSEINEIYERADRDIANETGFI